MCTHAVVERQYLRTDMFLLPTVIIFGLRFALFTHISN